MPKRTNEKQQIIEILNAMTAPEGATVTPSKFLQKKGSRAKREVDVVIEHILDDEVFTQSFEIVARGRPATVEWVEQMLGKHSKLPTDRLYLVSWQGFTKEALQEIGREDWVTAVSVGEQNGTTSLTSEELQLSLSRIGFLDGRAPILELDVEQSKVTPLYKTSGEPWLQTAFDYGARIVCHPHLMKSACEGLSSVPRAESATYGTLEFPEVRNLSVKDATGALTPVVRLVLMFSVRFARQTLSLDVRQFRRIKFGHTNATILGQPVVLVAELSDALQATRFSAVRRAPPSSSKRKPLKKAKPSAASAKRPSAASAKKPRSAKSATPTGSSERGRRRSGRD